LLLYRDQVIELVEVKSSGDKLNAKQKLDCRQQHFSSFPISAAQAASGVSKTVSIELERALAGVT
jgi:hypothetical protein